MPTTLASCADRSGCAGDQPNEMQGPQGAPATMTEREAVSSAEFKTNTIRNKIKVRTKHMTAQTWTTERVELLNTHFHAGLSCRQIAAEIGVSRNAVIGKLTRLNLTREKKVKPPSARAAARGRGRGATPRPRQRLLNLLQVEPEPSADGTPIHTGHCCSLFELTNERCRWPISTPGADDFCFCGSPPVAGLPYCAGHSRLAYRVTRRASRRPCDVGPS